MGGQTLPGYAPNGYGFADFLLGLPGSGHVDWNDVGPQEILDLSERLFDAAGVPDAARAEYYRVATQYFYQLEK